MDNIDIKSKLSFTRKDIIDNCISGMNLKFYKNYQWEKGQLSQWDTGSKETYYNYNGELSSDSHEEEKLWNDGVGVLSVQKNARDMGYGVVLEDEGISYLAKNGYFNLVVSLSDDQPIARYVFKASFSTPIGNFVINDDVIDYYDEDLINSYVEIRTNERLKNHADQSIEMRNILFNDAKTHYKTGNIDDLDAQIMTNSTRQFSVSLNDAISFANALANGNMETIKTFLDSRTK